MKSLKRLILFLSRIADTAENTAEERRQHTFLIFVGGMMSTGGIFWGSISLGSGLIIPATIPYAYACLTTINFTYLYFSKNFALSQAVQVFMSLLLPFLFQLSLGGFVSSGGMVIWSITAILAAFTFKHESSIKSWFVFYIILIVVSGLVDKSVRDFAPNVPEEITILFFVINISAISLIVFMLFYYFVGSERKYRLSLEENLQHLRAAQKQLIESEKMSALGGLVAGVAHEVNTPLGVSITAASVFEKEINEVKAAMEANQLTKSKLESFIDNVSEADDILIKNLNRAARLIKNFKKISVDQSSEDMREFELNAYLQEVISTFKSELKHRNIAVELQLSQHEIPMLSFPGGIAQIIINLLQNALFHAFKAHETGTITIKTSLQNDYAQIVFSDDGAGVDKSVEAKMFEPFVTTKRNKGGTGLGLNITYNLVTQHLGGTIRLDHDYTEGARFILTVPRFLSKTTDTYTI